MGWVRAMSSSWAPKGAWFRECMNYMYVIFTSSSHMWNLETEEATTLENYKPGQNLLRQIAKMPIFPAILAKTETPSNECPISSLPSFKVV